VTARLRGLVRDPKGVASFALLLAIVVAALAAPLIAPANPLLQSLPSSDLAPMASGPGGARHWLGTDEYGRDVLSRVIYGARVSLLVAVGAVFLAGVAGVTLGILAGFLAGPMDAVTMRLVDIQLAFPTVLLAIAWIAFIGNNLASLIAVVALSGWASYVRIARASALSLRAVPFVEAMVAAGASRTRIMLRHIVPNVMGPIIVLATLQLGRAVLLESTLSFLGLGVQPPTPSWGSMLADGRAQLDVAWWIAAFPGLAITLLVLGANLLGDALRDALDPRFEQRRA